MGTAPWLLHCCSFGDRGDEFQRANGVRGVHAQSLLVQGMGPGRWDAALFFCQKTRQAMVMKWGFQNGKGNGEMKGKGHHTSVVFCAIAGKKAKL